MSDDNRGEIDTVAIAVHEVFSAYIRAGFSRHEALELVKAQVGAAQKPQGGDEL